MLMMLDDDFAGAFHGLLLQVIIYYGHILVSGCAQFGAEFFHMTKFGANVTR